LGPYLSEEANFGQEP